MCINLNKDFTFSYQATSAAITKAFQTPSIIKMFAKNEPNALKDKRNQIERNMKLGKLNMEIGNRQKVIMNYYSLKFCNNS